MNRKEEQWRNEGAAYALRIAKEKGVEGLEKATLVTGIYKPISMLPSGEPYKIRVKFPGTDKFIEYRR